uniref:SPRY-associated domain-containing protein n=1 Tax=Sinocyclocheilus anshuiensis TaxID=1608454 RepID=A0A671RZK2_9TELE
PHSTLKRRSEMDMDSPLKDPSICSSVCWKSDRLSEKKLSPAHCSTIAYIFLGCNATAQHCEIVSSALQFSNSVLRELDLSNNDLQDSGVNLLSDGLKSSNCQLETLRLSGCMVTEEGCGYLSSALSSNPSHLRELDLSYNHPGPSGVQLLNHKLKNPNYKLQILNVDHGGQFMMTAGLRKYACDLTLDLNTINSYLMLSEENRKITHTSVCILKVLDCIICMYLSET